MRGKNHRFRTFYLILVVILIGCAVACFIYVRDVLQKYEASQPENLLSDLVDNLHEAAKENRITDVLSVPDDLKDSFSEGSQIYADYMDLLKSGELTFARRPGLDEKGDSQYVIKNGQNAVAAVSLHCKSETSALLILTISDYEIASVTPVYSGISMRLPSSLTVTVNGTNTVGKSVEGTDESEYRIVYLNEPQVEISDVYGNSVAYEKDLKIEVADYEITAPTNFQVTVGKTVLKPEDGTVFENTAYQHVNEYCSTLPQLCTWNLSMLSVDPKVEILNENGEPLAVEWHDRKFELTEQCGIETVPDEIMAEIDPVEVAENWSRFMTKDLRGKSYGYFTMKEWLINDSYIDNVAWEWVTGIDITFTSIHTLCDPPFLNEKIGRFVSYGDHFFSCDISFLKHMTLETGLDVKDPTCGTFYFCKYDDPDDNVNGEKWFLVGIEEFEYGGQADET